MPTSRSSTRSDRTVITVRYIRADGTAVVRGTRVRFAWGGAVEGSLLEEMARGVRTPVMEDCRADILRQFRGDPAAAEFVGSLPVVRLARRP